MIEIEEEKLIRCPVCEAVNIDKGKNNICRRCGSAIYHHRHFGGITLARTGKGQGTGQKNIVRQQHETARACVSDVRR